MVPGNYEGYKENQLNPYVVQKITSASPEQLISYIYDAAITACAKKNHSKAIQAVQALINALNFDYKDVSLSFFNVYRYINLLIQKSKFEEAKEMLTDIKKTWSIAMKTS
jgi:flagellin-specific chaperone FliS